MDKHFPVGLGPSFCCRSGKNVVKMTGNHNEKKQLQKLLDKSESQWHHSPVTPAQAFLSIRPSRHTWLSVTSSSSSKLSSRVAMGQNGASRERSGKSSHFNWGAAVHTNTTVSAQNAVIDHVTCCQRGNRLRRVHYSPQKGLKQNKGTLIRQLRWASPLTSLYLK